MPRINNAERNQAIGVLNAGSSLVVLVRLSKVYGDDSVSQKTLPADCPGGWLVIYHNTAKESFIKALFIVCTKLTRKICDAMHHGSRNVLDCNFKNISVTLTLYHTVEF